MSGKSWLRRIVAVSVVTGCVTAAVVALNPLATAAPAPVSQRGFSFAVIGDVPYGAAATAAFPSYVERINADPRVRMVTHLGDIKSGSTRCDTSYYEAIASAFDGFDDPLVYTPGDNEWTDCHRANNGAYQPLGRLDEVRRVFFSEPDRTLGGHRVAVRSQADRGFPENVSYSRAGVCFATLHVVGSNNDLAPWDGIGYTSPTPEQVAEEQRRMDATLDNVDRVFRAAQSGDCRAVVLQQQADMFDPTVTDPQYSDYSAFRPLVQRLVDESSAWGGPVYLFNGDSHEFRQDRPLASGSSWLGFYGVDGSADNLRRVTVDGSSLGESSYVRVTVDGPAADPLSVERVRLESRPGTLRGHGTST